MAFNSTVRKKNDRVVQQGRNVEEMALEKAGKPEQTDGTGKVGLQDLPEKRLWEITVCLAVSLGIMTETMRRDAVEAHQETHVEIIYRVQIVTSVCVVFISLALWHLSSEKKKQEQGCNDATAAIVA